MEIWNSSVRPDKVTAPHFLPTNDVGTSYVSDFLATAEGLALTRAFTRISDAKLRRSIVELVEQIANHESPDKQ